MLGEALLWGGYGYRLFYLAATVPRLEPLVNEAELVAALLSAYRRERELDDKELPFFLMLRALTYEGWITGRMDVPGAFERQKRAIGAAVAKVKIYLQE